MRNDMSSYFEDPEFKESLAKYEGMVKNHTPAYFDADELVDIAEYYTLRGKHKSANAVIDFALELHPNDSDALIFRARTLAIRGNLEEAYMVMDLIEDQSDREVKFLQADLLMEEGRMEEADLIFDQLANNEENELDTILDIILAYVDANQEELADIWFKRLNSSQNLVELTEKNQRFRDVMCDFYITFNKPAMAIPILKITLNHDPYSISHWNDLGKCYLALNSFEEANEAFDFSLAIDDKHPEALALKAFCYQQSGDLQKAREYFIRLAKVSKKKTYAYLKVAKIYINNCDYEEGLRFINRIIEGPDKLTRYQEAEVCSNLAICQSALDMEGEKDELIIKALELNEADSDIQINAGRYYLMEEKREEAIRHFEQALQLVPEDERYDTLFSIAATGFDLQDYELAIQYYEQLNKEFPEDAKTCYLFLLYSYLQLQQVPPCMHYLAKIKYETPEMYATLGSENEIIIPDPRFNELMRQLKDNISNGSIDLDKYL